MRRCRTQYPPALACLPSPPQPIQRQRKIRLHSSETLLQCRARILQQRKERSCSPRVRGVPAGYTAIPIWPGMLSFYLGEIDFRPLQFQARSPTTTKSLDPYPGGNKEAAARLKKCYALLELASAIGGEKKKKGLNSCSQLITRYPKSPEACGQRSVFTRLGAAGASPTLKSSRPSPRTSLISFFFFHFFALASLNSETISYFPAQSRHNAFLPATSACRTSPTRSASPRPDRNSHCNTGHSSFQHTTFRAPPLPDRDPGKAPAAFASGNLELFAADGDFHHFLCQRTKYQPRDWTSDILAPRLLIPRSQFLYHLCNFQANGFAFKTAPTADDACKKSF